MTHQRGFATVSERGYNRLAATYRWVEFIAFGRQLQEAREALIDRLPEWRRMLIFGDGDGRLLEAIIRHRHRSSSLGGTGGDRYRIVSVDQSSRMLQRQKRRVSKIAKVTDVVDFVHADVLDWKPAPEEFDIWITPFFLDCFSEQQLNSNYPVWLEGLRLGGTQYHVDFIIPASGPRRWRASILLKLMHRFFHWQTGLPNQTLLDLDELFAQHGMRVIEASTWGGGMIRAALMVREGRE